MALIVPVEDPNDPQLADYVRLRDVSLRRSLEAAHGLFLAEGEKVIRRAVAAGRVRRCRPLAGRQQSNPVSRVKLQRLGQASQRMKVRVPAGTTFQVRDPAHAKLVI